MRTPASMLKDANLIFINNVESVQDHLVVMGGSFCYQTEYRSKWTRLAARMYTRNDETI